MTQQASGHRRQGMDVAKSKAPMLQPQDANCRFRNRMMPPNYATDRRIVELLLIPAMMQTIVAIMRSDLGDDVAMFDPVAELLTQAMRNRRRHPDRPRGQSAAAGAACHKRRDGCHRR